MEKWKKFKFNDHNQRGIYLWAILAFCIVMTPRVLRYLRPSAPITLSTVEHKEMVYFKKKHPKKPRYQRKARYHSPPSRFNPNEYKVKDWLALGLSQKQAETVLKFCRYPIKSNEGLKKIFVIPDELYQLIKDSTWYPETLDYAKNFEPKWVQEETKVVLLSCSELDSVQLLSIKGIGPFYAKMIMKFEKALGGFLYPEQLKEVYKMNNETYEVLIKHIDFTKVKVRKISINQTDIETLNKHPYIDFWQAQSIVKMRKQIGGYTCLEQIKESHLINQEIFNKIVPYLSL